MLCTKLIYNGEIDLYWCNRHKTKNGSTHELYACLKSIEGVHLGSSGHLLNLLIDKFFNLPYLSIVRYADHIACQRVEMMIEPTKSDLQDLLTDEHMRNLDKFFLDFKYKFRHKRLLSLLEQLQQSLQGN